METIIDPSVDISHESNIRVQYRGSCSSSEPRIDHINFIFFNKNIARDWRWLEDSLELVREERHLITGSTFYFSRQRLLNATSALETMKNNLIMNWPLSVDVEVLNRLVKEVVQDATIRFGESVAPKCNILDMFVECIVEYNRTLESDEIEMSMEENEYYRMAPATDSSIGSLQRKIIDSETNESCSICLEELSSGCEAFCMPCSHMFHGDCIGEWLRTSHYCPNCRYEMPTY